MPKDVGHFKQKSWIWHFLFRSLRTACWNRHAWERQVPLKKPNKDNKNSQDCIFVSLTAALFPWLQLCWLDLHLHDCLFCLLHCAFVCNSIYTIDYLIICVPRGCKQVMWYDNHYNINNHKDFLYGTIPWIIQAQRACISWTSNYDDCIAVNPFWE